MLLFVPKPVYFIFLRALVFDSFFAIETKYLLSLSSVEMMMMMHDELGKVFVPTLDNFFRLVELFGKVLCLIIG